MTTCTADDVMSLMLPDWSAMQRGQDYVLGTEQRKMSQLAASANVSTRTLSPMLEVLGGTNVSPSNGGNKGNSSKGIV